MTEQINKTQASVVFMSFGDFSSCVQGSYWAIDTNPKEDALPTRPKKRPRSGERVSVNATRFPESKSSASNKVPASSFYSLFNRFSSLLDSWDSFASISATLPVTCTHAHRHHISPASDAPASPQEEGSLLI